MGRYRDDLFISRKSEPIPSPLPSPHVLHLPQRVHLYRLPINYLGNPANVIQAQTSSVCWLVCPAEMFSGLGWVGGCPRAPTAFFETFYTLRRHFLQLYLQIPRWKLKIVYIIESLVRQFQNLPNKQRLTRLGRLKMLSEY